ncbi:VOC family protein [uncultured Nocardioides sp.]|uniref:VOC family protein n=1 Tax=uncultured Nocardioides sp. TaxID=198441 RepID=UPI000C40CFCF|nr:VOC family protein [uncultured Nocardioides sp.]MAY95343.1 glyoxalase [Nocardioides sp.]MCK5929763.1 VOC family protein [Nocardioides sp.]
MDQRISFVTLAVRDVAAARAFYVDGLGWQAAYDGDDVVMVMVGPHLVLSLWDRDDFVAEVGPLSDGPAPITLAHNVADRAAVDTVLAEMVAAGGTLVGAPQEREWGGYTGYAADPDGYRWEIAWNPGPIGQAVLP